jgi:hypothetical protein
MPKCTITTATVLAAATLSLSQIPSPQAATSPFSATQFFSHKQKPASVITYTAASVPFTIAHHRFTIDVDGVIGATTGTQSPVWGGLLGHHWGPVLGWGVMVGVGAISDGKTLHVGTAFGLWRSF